MKLILNFFVLCLAILFTIVTFPIVLLIVTIGAGIKISLDIIDNNL
jgi:hypothetical protein